SALGLCARAPLTAFVSGAHQSCDANRLSCMKFIKENKKSKEWKAMKITVDFENGMQVSLTPENVHLVDNQGKDTVLAFKTDHTLVPIMFFKSLLATPPELQARSAAL